MQIDERGKIRASLVIAISSLIFSGFLLFSAHYFNTQRESLETRNTLFNATDEIADKLDGLIERLQQGIYQLPLPKNEQESCNKNLLSSLQNTVFNNPLVSGIVVRNRQNQILCSTLAPGSIVLHDSQETGLFGPVKNNPADEPAYILQQKTGSFFVDLYILKSVIERSLKGSSPYAQAAGLYDATASKTILQVERDQNNWVASTPDHYLARKDVASDNPWFFREGLINLPGYQIFLLVNSEKIKRVLLPQMATSFLLAILASLLFYYFLNQISRKIFSLQRAIKNAVKQKRYVPVYQPLQDLKKNSCIGVEVLMRWQSADGELILPDTFIKEAEESGQIVPMTLQLIEKSFQECADLLKARPDFHLGFNLSAGHFRHATFFSSFYTLCDQYQISSKQILLELTERELLNVSDEELANRMNELRKAGFSLAVDDFGTGHASISYLQHFPFNYLKIDKLFVSAIGTGAITETLNQSIIQMAKNLNFKIIAEGVESKEQLDFLRDHGVDIIQGWYFARAMTCKQLKVFLKANIMAS